MLAFSPMHAAEPAGASGVTPGGGKVATVKVDRRTGKLVRVVSPNASDATPAPLNAAPVRATPVPSPPAKIGELIERSANAHQMDPLLVHSVIQVESAYNPYAVSSKGAEGLMQLMPSTSRMLGVTNSFDPVENIEAGVKYLKYLQSVYHDDRLALAAYNAGPSAVTKYNEVPPYPETESYVEQVGQRYRAAREAKAAQDAEAAKKASAQAVPQDQPQETQPILEQFVDSDGRLYLKTVPRTQ